MTPPRGAFWVLAWLWVTAPMLLFVSWGLILEEGLTEPWLTVRMLLDPLFGVVALLLVAQVLYRDSGPPDWAIDQRRERRALWFGLAAIGCGVLSGMAFGAGCVAFVSLAGRRRLWWIVAATLTLAFVLVFEGGTPQVDLPWWELLIAMILLSAALILLGLYRGSRRDLVQSLRRESEALRVGRAALEASVREEERTRIAREMHDTISHRLALVALHAGALEYREDLPPAQVRDAVGVIRQGVQEAADELRSILVVLRSDGSDTRPAPTLADLDAVVAEVRRAGARVDLTVEVRGELAPAASAHLLRVVQEALTNAVKHAPGEPITVVVEGEPGAGARAEVRNRLPGRPVEAPGAQVGLVGLRERISLVGGSFAAGAEGDVFIVRAWVPWTS